MYFIQQNTTFYVAVHKLDLCEWLLVVVYLLETLCIGAWIETHKLVNGISTFIWRLAIAS